MVRNCKYKEKLVGKFNRVGRHAPLNFTEGIHSITKENT